MAEKKFTNELKKLFDYIQNTLLKQYDCDKITTEYFIVAILDNDFSIGNKILSKIMLLDTMEAAQTYFYQWLSTNTRNLGGKKEYDDVFEKSIQDAKKIATLQKSKTINSGHVLSCILNNNTRINKYFKLIGVTHSQIQTQVEIETKNLEEERKNELISKTSSPIKHTKKIKKEVKSDNIETNTYIKANDVPFKDFNIQHGNQQIGECEKTFINLNKEAEEGHVENIYGNEEIYDSIFSTLAKKNKNNVILVGKSGVGKTYTIRNLANLITKHKTPKQFKDKILLEVNFNTLFSGTGMRGSFETKLKALMSDARNKGNYIFFIDNLSEVLSNKYNESDMNNFIESIMNERKIMLICTCSEKGYTKEIVDYPQWERFFEKITLEEPTYENTLCILEQHAKELEYFHDVKFNNNVLETCIKYSKRYITERQLPDSAIDILDKAGAKISLSKTENEEIKDIREKLNEIQQNRKTLNLKAATKQDYDELEKLEKKEIKTQSMLNNAIKIYNLEKKPSIVTEDDIKGCISDKTSIPLKSLTIDDKERLNGLNDRIKRVVIGQDTAIDEVCKAIKRQRIGIGNPNKPIVFFFGGTTGVGKTYLAKTIANELWGNEKNLIRLDMSEYSETNSVTKLYGAPPSYVGYGDSVSLADKLKGKKHCILLLDEIEKACDKVYNVFLQLFDEGRITDNKGNTIDCKNIIVIMTSNIGAKEISTNKQVGFIKHNVTDINKDIIKKELKKTFNPEFLNRVDDFIYFNKLSDDDIKKIVKLDIEDCERRINNIGYYFEDNIKNDDFISYIVEKLNDKEDFGARPIKNIIQSIIEDKICDMIVENKTHKGYFFKKEDFI